MILKVLLLLLCGASLFASTTTPSTNSNNLLSEELFIKQLSWVGPEKLWNDKKGYLKINDKILTLTATKKGSAYATVNINVAYEVANKYEISFDYKSKGQNFVTLKFSYSMQSLEKSYNEFNLPSTAEWKKVKKVITAPELATLLTFTLISRDNSQLNMKNVVLKPLPVENKDGKNISIAGKNVNAIYYEKDNYFAYHAAKILQKQLQRAGARVLPLKVGTGDKGINIGGSSTEVGDGGYTLDITSGKVVIKGNRPDGQNLAVLKLLEEMGIVFYTPQFFSKPEKIECKAFSTKVTPNIAFRTTGWSVEMPELMGLSDPIDKANYKKVGTYRGYSHVAPYFLPYDEFYKTNPEFFALQADGKRLQKFPGKRFDAHFCMTNDEALKIITKRFIDFIKTEPFATYFDFFPGDGGNMYCKCKECEKIGNLGDRNIYWTNKIAREVKKHYPNVKIITYAYVDSRFPPKKYIPESNVIVQYCPYEPVWMNHLITNHPDNAQGQKDLDEWEKICPNNMGAFVYPSSCREKLNIWPAFYANLEKYQRFSKNKYKSLHYCGLTPQYNVVIPDSNNFIRLGMYVYNKVLVDDKTDVEKEINKFMTAYYGPGAVAMRKYFDLIHKEVVDRQWSQNTEKSIRGLVTKKLAKKGYQYFAEAEKVAKGEYLDHVLKEKFNLLWHDLTDNSRGNGKISVDDMPEYAQKLAEFCKIAKKYNYHFNTIPYKKWFWDNAAIKIDAPRFYDDPIIVKLMNNPLDTLLKSVPRAQKKEPYGYFIANDGMLGGIRMKTSWLKSSQVWATNLRRSSSGYGTVQVLLNLDKKPTKDVTLSIYGVDNEKKEIALMDLKVNGKSIYAGKVPWGKDDWSYEKFVVPADILKKGDNSIVLLNTTPDTEVDGVGGVNFVAKRNYYWGWFMIENIKVEISK